MTMNDESNPSPIDPANVGALLRAAADGELGAEDRQRLEALIHENPELASCVDFERELRGACARAMKTESPACPEAVRARIESMRGGMSADGASESVPLRVDGATQRRSFWQRGGALGAMAAALLIAGGVLLWNSASFLSSAPGVGAAPSTRVSYAERIGDFVAGEHARCLDERSAQAKFFIDEPSAVRERYTERFGAPVRLPDSVSRSEITFYGAGDCHLPSTPASAHLRFDMPTDGGDPVHMSLFVAPDPGLMGLEEGVTYAVDSGACAARGASLFVWSVDGLMYVLVTEAPRGSSGCAKIRELLRAPAATRSL